MKRAQIASFLLLAALVGPAPAAPVLLTFDDIACASGSLPGPTSVACTTSGQPIGSDYGSTTGLSVEFVPRLRAGNPGQTASNFGTPGDLGVVELGNSSPGPLSEIVFTPSPGYEVSLISFARSRGTNTNNPQVFEVLFPGGVFALSANGSLAKVTAAVNSPFSTEPVHFRYGSMGGATRVDDILLELRPVPEPTACSILLAAAAGLGSCLGLRRNQR